MKYCDRCRRAYDGRYATHRLSNEHAAGVRALRPHPYDELSPEAPWCRVCGYRDADGPQHVRAPRSIADLFPDSAPGERRERGVPGQRSSTALGTRARRLRAAEASPGVSAATTTAGRATG